MLRKVVFGPLREPSHDAKLADSHETPEQGPSHSPRPIGWHEIAGLAPLMVLIVAIGVYPRPIFERISPAVRPYVDRFYVPPVDTGQPGMGTARNVPGLPVQPRSAEITSKPSHVDKDPVLNGAAYRAVAVNLAPDQQDQDRPR